MLDTGYWLLVTGYWLLATGYWLLVTGYWLLATGYWLLVTGYWFEAWAWGVILKAKISTRNQKLTHNPKFII